MIDFACKQFRLQEIVKCGLGLSKADLNILQFMMKETDEWFSSNQLAKKLNLDLSTIQRSIKKLFEKEVVLRRQENLSGGGYVFLYQVIDKKEIKSKLMKTINSWVKRVEDELDKW